MIYISHRGNLHGPVPMLENQPDYINRALASGYDVEIDVWYNKQFVLGHDFPQYVIDEKFLENSKLWCHAKNYDALDRMLKNKKIHCFWHQEDEYTVTSRNIIWNHPDAKNYYNSIIHLKTKTENIYNCYGICSDYIIYYKERLK